MGGVVEADRIKLQNIPGLRIDPTEDAAFGFIDAVAVAAKRLGRAVPEQVIYHPNFVPPDSKTARNYQLDGIRRLVAVTRKVGGALLSDDVGLGKTLQAIHWAKSVAKDGRILIVCPAYVRETWRQELAKWGEVKIAILGPKSDKAYDTDWEMATKAQWVVASYEGAAEAFDVAFDADFPAALIMDEAHVLRGRKSKRGKSLEEIAALSGQKLAVTATPMWSRPRDFYQLLRILFGNRLGTGFDFDIAYCGGRLNDHGGVDNKGATLTDELKLRLSYYMVRRTKDEVKLELPSLTRQVVWLDGSLTAQSLFINAMRARTPGLTQKALEATLESKMEAAVALAAQAKRFLLFTYRKDHAHHMASILNREGTPCVCITGDMPQQKRAAEIKTAQSQGWGVVATIDSLGAGVNLQGVASFGIMHWIDWVPLKLVQGEGRLHRMGQKDPVTWVYLACRDTMDSRVVTTVVEKMDQWRAVMGAQDGKALRDSLGDHMDGAGGESEQAALKALYEAM